ncbi:hypothetical protein [uncultured Tateyamaria sp.]|uniref:hypothetical protein n=1 Tax=Tateyamaria sp. 1078 TaxID=3417464 RepID=UPI0026144CEC|nr:hypothetical protein [uncultured Tateyamaria sp.]
MPFNATHTHALEKMLTTMKPGDFFLVNNGYERNNKTFWNGQENTAIRAVSGVNFGHASLYIGGGRAMEMPVKLDKVKDIFASDRTNAVACVKCNQLNARQRARIKQFVFAYYDRNMDYPKGSYDIAALMVGSVGELGNLYVRKVSAHCLDDDEAGDMIAAVTRPAFQIPATLSTMALAKANEWAGNMPALSCAGLITYAHKVAGHIIDDGWVSHPIHSTPASLWDIVSVDKAKYSVEILEFFDDHAPAPKPKEVVRRSPESAGNAPNAPVHPGNIGF